jgi:hypothetical protein
MEKCIHIPGKIVIEGDGMDRSRQVQQEDR